MSIKYSTRQDNACNRGFEGQNGIINSHFKWANCYRLMQAINKKPVIVDYLNYKGV